MKYYFVMIIEYVKSNLHRVKVDEEIYFDRMTKNVIVLVMISTNECYTTKFNCILDLFIAEYF